MPGDFSRQGRVALLAEVAGALFAGEHPSREAALFVAAALTGWLAQGGDLTRDYLRVTAPRGSHDQPWRVYARLIDDERQAGSDREDCSASSTPD